MFRLLEYDDWCLAWGRESLSLCCSELMPQVHVLAGAPTDAEPRFSAAVAGPRLAVRVALRNKPAKPNFEAQGTWQGDYQSSCIS